MFYAYNIIILLKNIKEYIRQRNEINNKHKHEKLLNFGYNK